MAHYFSFLLMIFGFTRIYSITTINRVSVKAGHSLTIPCNYDTKYTSNVKYLCKGYTWTSCSYEVKTNQAHHSGKFTISDDKKKRIFTVTINHLTISDTDYYWCAVEINNRVDDGVSFYVSVTTDAPALYTDHQEITGFIGDNMRIWFHSRNPGEVKWCRLGSSCATVTSNSIDGKHWAINENPYDNFTVTMSELSTESSGWYYFVKGDLQMPVHLTVTERPSTTTLPPTTHQSTTTHHTTVRENQTFTTFKHEGKSSDKVDLKKLIIPLALLIFIVMMTLIIWFILKTHRQRKVNSSATVKAEGEVTYCDVKYRRRTSVQAGSDVKYCNTGNMKVTSDQMPCSDVDVIYSSVVTKK
ncbi:uncharacterized protein LOC114870697 [Betta splendens]|uniref:Uncharacterized protein LOC114870697 n=1 Tax=Betta splendens TaxID=158456 RepID=A0A6P7PI36_BETSP|nr:uncharacterized protein LOC114870697 [Betta splendens]